MITSVEANVCQGKLKNLKVDRSCESLRKMVANSLNLLVNQECDEMSLRSHKIRVTFSEEIEMDSLEPDVNRVQGKGVLGTIKEYEYNGQIVDEELEDENFNEFNEFDVSFCASNAMNASMKMIKLMAVSLCSKSCEKLSHEVQLCFVC